MESSQPQGFLAGEGQMARLIRVHDWSQTSLGAPDTWSAGLRTAVRMLLASSQPMFVLWGDDALLLYNDAFGRYLDTDRHPASLGTPAASALHGVWSAIESEVGALLAGMARHDRKAIRIPLDGELTENCACSISPIDDDTAAHGIGGVIALCAASARPAPPASTRLFESLFEQTPAFMALLTGPRHVFAMVNPAYQELFKGRELLGRELAEVVPEAASQGYVDILDKVFETGKTFDARGVRFSLQNEGHRRLYLDFTFQPIRDGAGKIRGVFALGLDVSGKHAAEEAIHTREEQLRLATDGGGIGLWDVDVEADTLYWNRQTREMFGIFSGREVSLRDFYQGLHPEDFAATADAFAKATDPTHKGAYDVEYRTIGKEDGMVRWVAARGRAIFDENARCTRIVGVAIDVTQRKQAQQLISDLNERLEKRLSEYLAERKVFAELIEGTDAFVQVSDLAFNWLAINKASASEFERIYGTRPRVGDNMLELLSGDPSHQTAVRAVWQRALDGEEFVQVGEFGLQGRRRHYEMRFRTLRDTAGKRIGAYQFVYDVTERVEREALLQRTEAALAQAQKMEAIGQLTGGLAHDFNNLLQAIMGNFNLIAKVPDDATMVERWAEKGKAVTQRAAALTAQLLAFSREQSFDLRPVSLGDLLGGLQPLIQTTLGSRVRYEWTMPSHDVWVKADATQLEMALLNVVINARDAMLEGGVVKVRVMDEGPDVTLSISDNGPGMSAEVRAKCFEPFFTTKPVGKGSGLGLSQVYGMCKRIGGTAEVRSEPGDGTTIAMHLPRSKAPHESVPVLQGGDSKLARARSQLLVLVVDDDDDVREFLAKAVASLGHRVRSSGSGTAALEIIAAEPVELLLADFSMPNMDGAELARRALMLKSELRVIFASGHPDADAFHAAVGRQAVVLRKPFDIDALGRAIGT